MRSLSLIRQLALVLAIFAAPALAESALPTLWLIGDSTVNKGSGKGDGGLWGWGAPLAGHFDSAKIKVRKYVAETKAKGATPVVLSQIPRNLWKDGKVSRAAGDYGKWAREAAAAGGALFLDLNEIVARHYEEAGQEKVKTEFFTEKDHTHTTAAGAKVNAAAVAGGIKTLKDCPLAGMLAPAPADWKP